jgi:hypothetical protein
MDEIKATEILDEAIGPDCCGPTLLSLRKKPRFEKPVSAAFTRETNEAVVEMRPWTFAWASGDRYAGLNGMFTADELEAISWWMRNNVTK